MQIDFGQRRVEIDGTPRLVSFFVATLGYSRRLHVRAFVGERQEHWFEGMESAFAAFGGVTAEVLLDNARALILSHDAASREVVVNPKLHAFARHWGFQVQACAPYRPRTKGKDERGVGYVKRNAIAGRGFASFAALEAHLAQWTREIADQRVHGTTGEAPMVRFARDEAKALQPLPGCGPFLAARELSRRVGPDCAVELDTNAYSVPWRLIGERVRVLCHGRDGADHPCRRRGGPPSAQCGQARPHRRPHPLRGGRWRRGPGDPARRLGRRCGDGDAGAAAPARRIRGHCRRGLVMSPHTQDDLDRMLTRLKLTAMRDQLDSLLDEAVRSELTLRDALAFLCEREIARKDQRRIDMSFGLAKFPFVRDLAGFDFAAQPSLDRAQIRDLATGRFIANGDALLLLGPPGVGKTHLAVGARPGGDRRRIHRALHRRDGAGGEPCQGAGRRAARGAADTLREAEAAHRRRARLPAARARRRAPVLPAGQRRYERGSTLITSNRAVGEWGAVFGDPVVATAILDRLLHHSHVITIRGDSYRLREKRRSGLLQKPASAPETETASS